MMLAATIFLVSCEQDFGVLNSDNRPDIPLTFPNATTVGFDPYIEVPISGDGTIRYELHIPSSSGRTIREITKVVGGASDINTAALNNRESYIVNPVQINDTTGEFITSIAEFEQKVRTNAAGEVTPVAVGQELAFLFLVTLDNDEEIVSMRVRARIVE